MSKREAERYFALPERDYDGSVVVLNDDTYLFDEDELRDRLAETEYDGPESVRIVFAELRRPYPPSISEVCCDDLAEDQEWDTSEIDEVIRKWCDENSPKVYWPTKVRVSVASIRKLMEDVP